jgi:hypothetical protein
MVTVKVAADTPRFSQGDTSANPRPDPRDTRMRVVPVATNAPAMIAGHAAGEVPLVEGE